MIPDKVKIGGITYAVKMTNKPDRHDKDIDGNINYSECIINVSNGFNESDDYKEYVLTHEIVHGIFNLMAIEKNEELVEKIGKGLYAVIKDNPGIFDFKEASNETKNITT
jgi:endonuclease V-like protein UPF0215 family